MIVEPDEKYCELGDHTVQDDDIDVQDVQISLGGFNGPPEFASVCDRCLEERRKRPEPRDVECMVCGETIEGHIPDDSPIHSECEL
jgi:hypothetical protein